MEKRTIITEDMRCEMRIALAARRDELEKSLEYELERGKEDHARMVREWLEAVEQLRELIKEATWII